MRLRLHQLLFIVAIGPLLYVLSFVVFQAFPYTFSLAPPQNPQHYLVVFSMNTEVHCAARAFYAPLIWAMPGHRHYPTRAEHERLKAFSAWLSSLQPISEASPSDSP